jgi:hypothetical protein
MRRTPEGKVKDKISDILQAYAPYVWYHMAVVGGMGKPTLDYTGCCVGKYFAIEAKADNKDLTPQQKNTARDMRAAQGKVFEIRSLDDEPAFDALDAWLRYHVGEFKSCQRFGTDGRLK